MTILRKRPLTTVALGALFVGAISCGGTTTAPSEVVTPTPTPTCIVKTPIATTDTDNLKGDCGNDTAVFEQATTLNPSDLFDGGVGTDTAKFYGDFDSGTIANLTNVEIIEVVKPANSHLDFSAQTKAITGVEKIQIDDANLLSAKTITTTTGQSLSLSTGASGKVTAGTVTWAGSAVDTTLNLILNGYQWILGGTPAAVTVTGAAATTLNIASTGAENKTGAFTGPVTVKKHVVTGDKKLTYALAAADAAALTSIDGSANSGGTIVDVSAATTKAAFAFTGGSGDDTITFADNNLGSLTAGTQIALGGGTGDKVGTKDTAFSAAEYAALNAATGVEVVGLNAAITVAAGSLTSIKQFSVDTTALTQTINTLPTGSKVTFNAAAPTSLTLTGDTGVTDVTIALDVPSSTTNQTVGTLDITGLTSVAMSSNGSGSKTNAITTLTNSDSTVFTLTGTQQLTFTLSGTAVGSTVNASAMTGALIVTGSGYKDILTGSTADDSFQGMAGGDLVTAGGGVDTAVYTAAAQTYAGVVTSGVTVLSGIDTYTGFGSGDKFTMFAGATITTSTAISLTLLAAAGTTDTIALVPGTFNATTGVFTYSTSGADALLQWDSNGTTAAGNIESAVIYGFGAGAVSVSANTITLN